MKSLNGDKLIRHTLSTPRLPLLLGEGRGEVLHSELGQVFTHSLPPLRGGLGRGFL